MAFTPPQPRPAASATVFQPPRPASSARLQARRPRRQTSWALRMMYCLALLAPIVPAAVIGGSGWVAMNAGASAWSFYRIVAVLLVLARFVFVLVRRRALQAYAAVRLLRVLGIAAMIVGSALALASLFFEQITLWSKEIPLRLLGPSSDPGAGLAVIVAVLSYGAYLATIGVVVFELNRGIGGLKAAYARVIDRLRSRSR